MVSRTAVRTCAAAFSTVAVIGAALAVPAVARTDPSAAAAAAVTGARHPTGVRAAATAPAPKVTKVVVFMVENHSLTEMLAHMPFMAQLSRTYSYATNYSAIRHPSLPNYLAIAGGSTFSVTNDGGPGAHPLKGISVFDQALNKGLHAKTYADSMPVNCDLANSGEYAVRHNPWTYFVDSRQRCRSADVPVGALATDTKAGTLPNVSFVIPNLIHDAHNGTLAQADTWIKAEVNTLRSGRDWTSGRLAIVITADEDDHSQGNRVLTVVASSHVGHHVVTASLNHYSLTRFIDDVLGVPYLRNASTASSMRRAFGIPTLPRP